MPAVTPYSLVILPAGRPDQALEPVRLHPDVHLSNTPAMTDHADGDVEVGLLGARRGRSPSQSRAPRTARPKSSRCATRRAASERPRRRSTWAQRWPNTAAGAAGGHDPQGALSAGLGVPHYELDKTVHNLLVEPRRPSTRCSCHPLQELDLVPSNIDLSAAEIQLVNEVGREQTLAGRCTRCWTATTTC